MMAYMKFTILFSLFSVFSCTNHPLKTSSKSSLTKGEYYATEWRHTDTIVFQKRKPNTRTPGWTEMFWTITKDTIYQRDSRGLIHYFGLEKGTYRFSNDTLIITAAKTNQKTKQVVTAERYKILLSNDTLFKLLRLDHVSNSANSKIREDIVLR